VCRLEEGGRPKCHKYWPSSDGDAEFSKLMRPGYKVVQLRESDLGGTLKERVFQIKGPDGSIFETRQLHYVGWPDHGVPTGASIDDFTLMLNHLITMLLNSPPDEKAIIHCSAGIGRTGTTAALAHLMINLAS
jgi:protein tyrosine phosphatase